jgi:predicted small secreted protein
MARTPTVLALLVAAALLAACATMAGGMIGSGIGRAAGDEEAGRLIGAGVGMMVDIMD